MAGHITIEQMSETIQTIRGMHDVLPEQAHAWEYFEDTVRDWLRAYGYRQIRMPVLEKTELFVRGIGEVTDIVEKEMYSFVDQLDGEGLTLRPEGTASCMRAVVQHNLMHTGAQRLFYMGPMFRHERPQKGRYRQFHQVGVETVGYTGPDIDAEHLIMAARLWQRLGIEGLRLQINTLGSSAARARYRARLIAYLQSVETQLDEDSRRRMHRNPLRVLDSKNPAMAPVIEAAPQLAQDLDDDSVAAFDLLQSLLIQAGVAFEVNPRLVRGLDYYNDAVYEWITDRLGAQAAVCAGGRYDGLVPQIGGKPTPACGYAMGVERLLALMEDAGRLPAAAAADVYLVHAGEQARALAWPVAEKLRDNGVTTVLHCGGGSFKSQMKRADASGARYAVIIGDDEAARQEVAVKALRAQQEQQNLPVADAIALLAAKAK